MVVYVDTVGRRQKENDHGLGISMSEVGGWKMVRTVCPLVCSLNDFCAAVRETSSGAIIIRRQDFQDTAYSKNFPSLQAQRAPHRTQSVDSKMKV